MRYEIDFSIFESPIRAYGNVTGELELASHPKIGDVVEILRGALVLRVQYINVVDGRSVIGFDDVVTESPSEAKMLAERLEGEEGLFCPGYHEP